MTSTLALNNTNFAELGQSEMMKTNGGLVFTTAGIIIGLKLGAKAVATYGAKKAIIGTTVKLAGGTGVAMDAAVVHHATK